MTRATFHGVERGFTALLFLVFLVSLAGCDESDGGWPSPGDPPTTGQPDLRVTVDHQPAQDDHVNQGEEVGFLVELSNQGNAPADAIVVSVSLPEVAIFVSADAGTGIFDAGTGLWDLEHLEPGAVDTLSLIASVPEGTVGEILRFAASVTASVPVDSTRSDNVDSLQVPVVNRPPDADDDGYVVLESAILSVGPPGLMTNDLDFEGETIVVDIIPVMEPHHGELVLQADGGFQYRHDGSEALADSFLYRVTDTTAESDTAMVRMEVVLVNDPPEIMPLEGYTVDEGGSFAPIELAPLATDNDHDTASLVWQAFGGSELGVALDESFVLTVTVPHENWNGSEELTLRVIDPAGAHAHVQVPFTVTSINDPPQVAVLPTQVIQVGGAFLPFPLDSFVSDIDHADEQIIWSFRDHEPLQVEISAGRVLTVVPPGDGWTGVVTMTLRATDLDGGWAERPCRFEVTAPE